MHHLGIFLTVSQEMPSKVRTWRKMCTDLSYFFTCSFYAEFFIIETRLKKLTLFVNMKRVRSLYPFFIVFPIKLLFSIGILPSWLVMEAERFGIWDIDMERSIEGFFVIVYWTQFGPNGSEIGMGIWEDWQSVNPVNNSSTKFRCFKTQKADCGHWRLKAILSFRK